MEILRREINFILFHIEVLFVHAAVPWDSNLMKSKTVSSITEFIIIVSSFRNLTCEGVSYILL